MLIVDGNSAPLPTNSGAFAPTDADDAPVSMLSPSKDVGAAPRTPPRSSAAMPQTLPVVNADADAAAPLARSGVRRVAYVVFAVYTRRRYELDSSEVSFLTVCSELLVA